MGLCLVDKKECELGRIPECKNCSWYWLKRAFEEEKEVVS